MRRKSPFALIELPTTLSGLYLCLGVSYCCFNVSIEANLRQLWLDNSASEGFANELA